MLTTSPLKRRKRFSVCCPAIILFLLQFFVRPADKEESILIWILQRYKATSPTFIHGRLEFWILLSHLLVERINIIDAEKEMYASSPAQHRLQLLDQGYLQFSRPQRSHWRLSLEVKRLDFKTEYVLIKGYRFFKTVDLEKE